MSDSSDLQVRVSPRGATVHRASDPPTLVAAADLPEGGLVALDLTVPATVVALFLTAAHWAELGETVDDSTDLDALGVRLRERVATADLPEPWLRVAFVSGLARWYPDALDEGLLAADLAAAQAAAGLTAEAEQSWQRAEPAVTRLLAEPVGPLVQAELARVLAAVGSDVVLLPPRAADPLSAAVGDRAARYRSRARTLPVEQNLRPVADPRNLPARALLAAGARLEPSGEGVLVTCPASSTESLVVDDLVAIVYDEAAGDPRAVASTSLPRDGERYRGMLAGGELAQQIRSNELVVELRSAASVHPPLLDVNAAAVVEGAQRELVRLRRDRAAAAADDATYSRLTLAEQARR